MAEPPPPTPPPLTVLCVNTLTQEIISGDDNDVVSLLQAIYDLPSHLVDALIKGLPPIALRKFHRHLSFQDLNGEVCSQDESTNKRKRAREWNLNTAWKKLFELRWPDLVNRIQPTDWQNAYWEAHLQKCLDEAAEIALITTFNGSIGDIQISDSVLEYIGFLGHTNHSKLSYHCLQFGSHVSCLRLQNVLCTAETRGLLRECKLQSLVLRCIRSKEQVNGLCKILTQHSRTLTSLEFIHCTINTYLMNAIFDSVVTKGVQKHGIKHLSIVSSSLEDFRVLHSGLVSFLSSARDIDKLEKHLTDDNALDRLLKSLCTLKLSGSHIGRPFAKALFTTLLNLSSGISVLDLSDNDIGGWLSDYHGGSSVHTLLSAEFGKSLQLLRVLNLRGNSLRKGDVESLRYALAYMPNLEDLDISENPIGDEGIRNLIPCFDGTSKMCPRMTCLKLDDCEMSFDGVKRLLNSLYTFKGPLKSLSIADNYLGGKVADALGRFLTTPIEILDVAGIGLGPSGFEDLQNLVKGELKLVKINISKNRGRFETANFISKLLSHAPQLTDVNAASNLMPIESLPIISSALKLAKGNIQHLDLTGHSWDLKPEHASLRTEFVHNGKPILILPSSSESAAPYDDDP